MSPMAVGSIGSPKTREGQWSCSAGSKGENGLSPQGQEGGLDQTAQFCGHVQDTAFRTEDEKQTPTERPGGKALSSKEATCMGKANRFSNYKGILPNCRQESELPGQVWIGSPPPHKR